MNCKNCGQEMEENTKVCSSCGYDMGSEQDSKSDSVIGAKKSKSGSVIIISVAAALVLLISIFLYMVVFGGVDRIRLSRLCDLGDRYLSELDFEQAVASYQAAIEIDPKCEEAYLGLAEVYIEQGEYEKAAEILEAGLAQIDSETIRSKLDEVEEMLAERERPAEEEVATEEEVDAEEETTTVLPSFVSWADAGLEDYAMDWQDEVLEARIRNITGIAEGDIMLSDVWEYVELDLSLYGKHNHHTSYNNDIRILDIDGIHNINALNRLTNLKYLYLHNNNISDISALTGLTNLVELDLDNNNISDISVLSGLTNLKELYLGSNYINDISALSGMTNLVRLELGDNNISDISALSGLTNLEILIFGDNSLHGNNISDINALSSLTNLKSLVLWSNNVSDISALSGLTNLKSLSLGYNNINDVSALSGLTNLEQLDLWENPITDYTPVLFVPDLHY